MTAPAVSLPEEQFALKKIVAAWWPLAISWMLMSAEPALLSAVVARLANPTINLAAYGSVTNPLIGMIQAPILTLLSLSTAMSKDWDSFQKGRRIMFFLGGGLTLVYLAITFTPLYYVIVEQWIGAPAEIVEPARLAMFFGIPWTFAVAYRRFHQGVMIRFDHSRTITIGTLCRFSADILVVSIALALKTVPGAVAATLMMVCGVITEAVYVGLSVRPVLRYEVKPAPPLAQPVELRAMLAFFIPMALTPFLSMLVRPIGSAALSRFPDPLQALAIWPVISNFSYLITTPGAAYNEVVIALLDRGGARANLKKFMTILMGSQLLAMLALTLTPLSTLWFWKVSGLAAADAHLAGRAFLLLIPSALISPLNSWFVGNILHRRKSRAITEGMVVYLGVYILGLLGGSLFPTLPGIYIAIGSATLSSIAQTIWLGLRAK